MIAVCPSILGLLGSAVLLPAIMGADGKMHRVLREAKGKPVALIFISHDCPVCNTFAPEIARIEAKYGDRIGMEIVYSEPRITLEQARLHAKEFSIGNATLLLDADRKMAAACGARITPEAIVLDSHGEPLYKGRIDDRYMALGHQLPAPTTHDLRLALDAVLAHQPPKPAAGPPVGCYIVLPHQP